MTTCWTLRTYDGWRRQSCWMFMTRDEAVVWCLHEIIQSPLNVLECASCCLTTHTWVWDGCSEYTAISSSYEDWTISLFEDSSLTWYDTIFIVEYSVSEQLTAAMCTVLAALSWIAETEDEGCKVLCTVITISKNMLFPTSFEFLSMPLWERQISCSGSLYRCTVFCLLQLWSVSVVATHLTNSILYNNCVC